MTDTKCPKCRSEWQVRDIHTTGIVDHVVDGDRCKRRQILLLRMENVRLRATIDHVDSAFEPDMDDQLAIDERSAVQACRTVGKDLA